MPVRSCTFGSAASAAIARPTNSGDSDCQEVRILLARLAPVVFGDAEVLQHGFRAQEAGRDGQDGDAMRRELGGPEEREHLLRHLDGLRHRIPAAADHVVLRDFDDEAALRGHHRERGVLRRDDARREPLPEDRVGVRQIRLPEEAVRAHQRVFARHAVDDDVEALVGAEDAAEQRLDLVLVRVIDANARWRCRRRP